MEIKSCEELNGMKPIPRAVTVSRIVKSFKSRQCIMSRVVTNRGRQGFRIAVNGESLSDDLKKNSQGRNPRTREEKQRVGTQKSVKKEQCQPQAEEQCQQQTKTSICDGTLECEIKLQSGETQF